MAKLDFKKISMARLGFSKKLKIGKIYLYKAKGLAKKAFFLLKFIFYKREGG